MIGVHNNMGLFVFVLCTPFPNQPPYIPDRASSWHTMVFVRYQNPIYPNSQILIASVYPKQTPHRTINPTKHHQRRPIHHNPQTKQQNYPKSPPGQILHLQSSSHRNWSRNIHPQQNHHPLRSQRAPVPSIPKRQRYKIIRLRRIITTWLRCYRHGERHAFPTARWGCAEYRAEWFVCAGIYSVWDFCWEEAVWGGGGWGGAAVVWGEGVSNTRRGGGGWTVEEGYLEMLDVWVWTGGWYFGGMIRLFRIQANNSINPKP